MGVRHSRGRLIPLPHGAALFQKLSYDAILARIIEH